MFIDFRESGRGRGKEEEGEEERERERERREKHQSVASSMLLDQGLNTQLKEVP